MCGLGLAAGAKIAQRWGKRESPHKVGGPRLRKQQAVWIFKALASYFFIHVDWETPPDEGWRALSAPTLTPGRGSPTMGSSGSASWEVLPTTLAAWAPFPFPSLSPTQPPPPLPPRAHTEVQGNVK